MKLWKIQIRIILFLSIQLQFNTINSQNDLAFRMLETMTCGDFSSFAYLPERDLCINIFNIDSIELTKDEIIQIESPDYYIAQTTLSEILSHDTIWCKPLPIFQYDRYELSKRRIKLKYEEHVTRNKIPQYHCISNKYEENLKIEILGFHGSCSQEVFYIDEQNIYRITQNQSDTLVDRYEYRIESDVLIGQFKSNFHLNNNSMESKEMEGKDINIEVCLLNKDCVTNHLTDIAQFYCWRQFQINNKEELEQIITDIKKIEK